MDLRQLGYFVGVVEAGSFSRAAVALNLAQPTLSRQIALLEADLGQRLFVRTGRGTGAGLPIQPRNKVRASTMPTATPTSLIAGSPASAACARVLRVVPP